jgi:preprotein translocase subunit SecE
MAKDKKTASSATIEGTSEEVKKKKRTSPQEFIQQVLAEGRKVTWTSRNETFISTVMVLIMVVIMALFFLAVDFVLRNTVAALLSIG